MCVCMVVDSRTGSESYLAKFVDAALMLLMLLIQHARSTKSIWKFTYLVPRLKYVQRKNQSGLADPRMALRAVIFNSERNL
jgi:hypothetical protein